MHSHCVVAPTRPHPATSGAPALAQVLITSPHCRRTGFLAAPAMTGASPHTPHTSSSSHVAHMCGRCRRVDLEVAGVECRGAMSSSPSWASTTLPSSRELRRPPTSEGSRHHARDLRHLATSAGAGTCAVELLVRTPPPAIRLGLVMLRSINAFQGRHRPPLRHRLPLLPPRPPRPPG